MSIKRHCEFCQGVIEEGTQYHRILIDVPDDLPDTLQSVWERYGKDCCEGCYDGQVILSESRRVRIRRKKAAKKRKVAITKGVMPGVNDMTTERISAEYGREEA